jgi:dolichol-phosphate mannosyltransferase
MYHAPVQPRVLLVVPTYNEALNVAALVAALHANVPGADVLIVDDGSPDGTGAIVDEIAARDPTVRCLHRAGKLGLGTAHVAGFDHAVREGYDVLVTMDCDFTHRPEDVPLLIRALAERGADVVMGSRYIHPRGIADWPAWRRAITRTAHLATKTLLGVDVDATNAFRAYRVPALAQLPYRQARGDGYSFMFEIAFLCVASGLSVIEVPVELPFRQAGESKISRAEVGKALYNLARLSVRRARMARDRRR